MKLLPPIESQDTMLTSLSYPLGFFVSPFLLFSKKKEDSFVRFHAIQGLIVNIIVTVIVLVGLFFLFLIMSKTSLTLDNIHDMKDLSKYEPNPMNNGYMNNGCVFMVVWGLYFLFVLILFLAEVFCASRVWAGEDLRLPLIGSFIEKKFFADIVAIEQEAEQTGGEVSIQQNKSSIDDLPTTRHDIPFVKNSTPPVTNVAPITTTQQVPSPQPKDKQSSIQEALAYAKRQQSLYNQQQTQQTTTQSNINYNNSLNQQITRTSYNEQESYNKSIQTPSRNYADGTSSTVRTRTYADGTSSAGRTNTYADGSAKKIQL